MAYSRMDFTFSIFCQESVQCAEKGTSSLVLTVATVTDPEQYLNIQLVPRSKHPVTVLYTEIIEVCTEIYTKPIQCVRYCT